MVRMQVVKKQLQSVGMRLQILNRPEARQLAHVLAPDEQIVQAASGIYEGGLALVCATDQRVLLIDQRPSRTIVEAVRYTEIADVNVRYIFLNSELQIFTSRTSLTVATWNRRRLRKLVAYIEEQTVRSQQVITGHPLTLSSYTAEQLEAPALASRRQPLAQLLPKLARLALR